MNCLRLELSWCLLNTSISSIIIILVFDFLIKDDDNEDIWDDTALIKAYDEAVSVMKVSNLLSEIVCQGDPYASFLI